MKINGIFNFPCRGILIWTVKLFSGVITSTANCPVHSSRLSLLPQSQTPWPTQHPHFTPLHSTPLHPFRWRSFIIPGDGWHSWRNSRALSEEHKSMPICMYRHFKMFKCTSASRQAIRPDNRPSVRPFNCTEKNMILGMDSSSSGR